MIGLWSDPVTLMHLWAGLRWTTLAPPRALKVKQTLQTQTETIQPSLVDEM